MSGPTSNELATHWTLDPSVDFLNHGSFGACPRAVLEAQGLLRAAMEREPVRFLARELEGRLAAARSELARFVGADAEGLAFVRNATSGVNTVVRSLPIAPGDEILATDHAYSACRNALAEIAGRRGARLVVARIPFPVRSADDVVEALLARTGPRTRFALVDHVTSPTGLVLPVTRLVRELSARGVEVVVDGAHAPGMLDLDVAAVGAAAYTGNCHKWLCAPKGAAFLWVRSDLRTVVRPLVISHGADSGRADQARFRLEFDWTGTDDPTAPLSVPVALRTIASFVPGGWTEVRERNRLLALEARRILAAALEVELPSPEAMIGSLAALPLPGAAGEGATGLQNALYERHRIEVPVYDCPAAGGWILRISAQLYNRPDQYRRLAEALAAERSR